MIIWGFMTVWKRETTGLDKLRTKALLILRMLITTFQKLNKLWKRQRVFLIHINSVRNSNSETNYHNEYTEKLSPICPSKAYFQK